MLTHLENIRICSSDQEVRLIKKIEEQIQSHISFVSKVHEINLIRFNGKRNGEYNQKCKYKLIMEMGEQFSDLYNLNEYIENNYFTVAELKKLK